MNDPFLSVVVPTYNRRSSLKRLLDGLVGQTYPSSQFEVIVVDDGSSDETVDFIRAASYPYGLRLIQQPHGGPAAARNRGVSEASGTLIVFLDDDVLPVPELLGEHVATHAREADAVVIGPMSPPGAWPRPVWVRWEEEMLQTQYRAMLAGLWSCTERQFYTGNASLARDRFLRAGGFDTTFQRAEDVELGFRLRRQGARFVFNDRADVLHYASRSFQSWCLTPYRYGRYDVVMQRDKGNRTLEIAAREFHSRNVLTRAVVRLCAGRRRIVSALVPTVRLAAQMAARIGAHKPAEQALSAIFNVLYWQGACDEIGDRRALWRTLAAGAQTH